MKRLIVGRFIGVWEIEDGARRGGGPEFAD
jgi:hypothetical protein